MSEVQRYSPIGDGVAKTDVKGMLVAYEDYMILDTQKEQLKAEVERLENLVRYWSEKYQNENARFLRASERIAAKEGKPSV